MHPIDLYDDAVFYDLLHEGYRDDIAFYRSLALDFPGRTLEVGAGTGRLTLEFARLAEQLVALEPAEAMRRILHQRIEAAEVDVPVDRIEVRGETVESYGASRPEGTFDLVVAPFNAFLHATTLDAQDAFLASCRAMTARGGLFAMDVMAPPRDIVNGVPRIEIQRSLGDGSHVKITRTQQHEEASQFLLNDFEMETVDSTGSLSRRIVQLAVRYFHRYELERALLQAGFSNVRMFGDFDRRPIDSSAEHWVVLASAGD